MDDPGFAWPFWKFGMKRDDLSTKLHDQYNTISSSIQDPDAFHHDVYEISHRADTADDFHRLMADRKEQRLKELNASLDLAAVEIIANPELVGTAQWSYALQLFRTRSLDSLVRLFSSYLPDDYCARQGYYTASSTGTSFSDRSSIHTAGTHSSLDDVDGPTFFHDDDEKPVMTHEPLHISTSITSSVLTTELPPSPRSMTMHSDTGASSPIDVDHRDYVIRNLTPARTLSFSGSESGRFAGRRLQCLEDDEEETSQSEDLDSLTTSVSDLEEQRLTRESTVDEEQHPHDTDYTESAVEEDDDCDDEFLTTQLPFDFDDDVMESSETPTPKPETTFTTSTAAASYLDSKTYSSLRSIPASSLRAPSPKIPLFRRRDASPAKNSSCSSSSSNMMMNRRSPEEASSRIQKPQPDAMRGARALAAKGRKRSRGLD